MASKSTGKSIAVTVAVSAVTALVLARAGVLKSK